MAELMNNKYWTLLNVEANYAIFIVGFSPATSKRPQTLHHIYLHSVWNTWEDAHNYLNNEGLWIKDAYIVNLLTNEIEDKHYE